MHAPIEKNEGGQNKGLPANPTVKVIGVGDAGAAFVGGLAAGIIENVAFAALGSTLRDIESCPLAEKHVLGLKSTRGLGSGGDPQVGRAAAEADIELVKGICAGADLVFIVAGLGGGTGGGAAPVVARTAREQGALVIALVTLPFDFEGTRRRRQACEALHQLKAGADCVLCLPNQRLLKIMDSRATCADLFKPARELMTQGFDGIFRLLTKQGLINVDIGQVCAFTRGSHLEIIFASVAESGEGRVGRAIEKLLTHPLLEDGRALAGAETVLVSLQGGPDLTVIEIDQFMEQLQGKCEFADVAFGALMDPRQEGRLVVTVITPNRAGAFASETGPIPARPEPRPVAGGKESVPEFFDRAEPVRPPSRFVPPPPPLTQEQKQEFYQRQRPGSRKKGFGGARQPELQLDIVSRGRFENSEPTIHRGEDLDVPTYIRRGVPLN